MYLATWLRCYRGRETDVMPAGSSNLLGGVAQHLARVDVACNSCPRGGKSSIARLMQEFGPEMPIPSLLRLLSVHCRSDL
jgi:hypothetical protein